MNEELCHDQDHDSYYCMLNKGCWLMVDADLSDSRVAQGEDELFKRGRQPGPTSY